MPLSSSQLSNWVSRIPSETLLCDVNLPGTHDSAAYNSLTNQYYTPGTFYACQDTTIDQQLVQGVRVLDIRLKFKRTVTNGNVHFTFVACHGPIGLGLNLNEYQDFTIVLDSCRQFLSGEPNEIIVMILKIDDWNSIKDLALKAEVLIALNIVLEEDPYTACLYRNPALPPNTLTLSTIRGGAVTIGKIYLVNQFQPDIIARAIRDYPILNLGFNINWEPANSNTTGLPIGNYAYVQDKWNLSSDFTGPIAAKYGYFTAAINTCSQVDNRSRILLNFASGTFGGLKGIYINNDVITYLTDRKTQRQRIYLGWSMFDYAFAPSQNLNCVNLVIESNFQDWDITKPYLPRP